MVVVDVREKPHQFLRLAENRALKVLNKYLNNHSVIAHGIPTVLVLITKSQKEANYDLGVPDLRVLLPLVAAMSASVEKCFITMKTINV